MSLIMLSCTSKCVLPNESAKAIGSFIRYVLTYSGVILSFIPCATNSSYDCFSRSSMYCFMAFCSSMPCSFIMAPTSSKIRPLCVLSSCLSSLTTSPDLMTCGLKASAANVFKGTSLAISGFLRNSSAIRDPPVGGLMLPNAIRNDASASSGDMSRKSFIGPVCIRGDSILGPTFGISPYCWYLLGCTGFFMSPNASPPLNSARTFCFALLSAVLGKPPGGLSARLYP